MNLYFPFHLKKGKSPHFTLICAYFLIGIAGLIALYVLPWSGLSLPTCQFLRLTGIPCPSCGMTRSADALAHFHILDSMRFNPLFSLALTLGAFYLMISVGLHFLTGHYLEWRLDDIKARVLRWLIILLIGANWVYLIQCLPR